MMEDNILNTENGAYYLKVIKSINIRLIERDLIKAPRGRRIFLNDKVTAEITFKDKSIVSTTMNFTQEDWKKSKVWADNDIELINNSND